MSIINKMLKDIDKKDPDPMLGLEPTVVVKKVRDKGPVLLRIGFTVIIISLAISAYYLIPAKESATQNIVVKEKVTEITPISTIKLELDVEKTKVKVAANELARVEDKQLTDQQMNEPQEIALNASFTEKINTHAEVVDAVKKEQSVKSDPIVAQNKKNVLIKSIVTNKPKREKENAHFWFKKGKESFHYGLVSDAIKHLEKALILAPKHIEARNLLTSAYYSRGEKTIAKSILLQGVKVLPEIIHWRILLAKLQIEQRQYSEVLSILSDEFEQKADIEFWILKGTAAQQLGKHQIAIRNFKYLSESQPQKGKWWLALATSNDAMGDLESAKKFYLKAVSLGGLSVGSTKMAQARLTYFGVNL